MGKILDATETKTKARYVTPAQAAAWNRCFFEQRKNLLGICGFVRGPKVDDLATLDGENLPRYVARAFTKIEFPETFTGLAEKC